MRLLPMVSFVCAAALLTGGCGGDDVFPKAEFVEQVTANGVSEPVADCTYDRMKSDTAVMDDIVKADGPNSKISAATDEKLSRIIAQCLLAAQNEGDDSTTETTEAK